MQQHFGQVFVLGNGFGNRAGGIGFGGLDAALAAAPAKLDEAAGGQAAQGNAPCQGGVDNRPCRRAEAFVFVEVTQQG